MSHSGKPSEALDRRTRTSQSRVHLALAAFISAAAAPAMADDYVTFYGRLNTAVEYASASTATDGTKLGNMTRVTNNRSVFGLHGEEELASGLRAIWQIESSVSIDTGDGQIAARNTRLGLQGPYGTILRAGVAVAGNGAGTAKETIGSVHSGSETGAFQVTVGYDYPLSKRTGLYTYYSLINNRSNAIYDFAINNIGSKAGADPQTFALGMRHNF